MGYLTCWSNVIKIDLPILYNMYTRSRIRSVWRSICIFDVLKAYRLLLWHGLECILFLPKKPLLYKANKPNKINVLSPVCLQLHFRTTIFWIKYVSSYMHWYSLSHLLFMFLHWYVFPSMCGTIETIQWPGFSPKYDNRFLHSFVFTNM